VIHPLKDIGASIASGSYLTAGMVVVPCSMGTLANIASGSSRNLLERTADVMLKEGRPLILVPRETPLHAIHLENLLKLSRMGVAIVPAMPAFYHMPTSIDDLVDFMVGKLLDRMGIEHGLFRRWGMNEDEQQTDATGADRTN
jgi:4-hydroxy-3-polyprenylbenzoate decarboxylase